MSTMPLEQIVLYLHGIYDQDEYAVLPRRAIQSIADQGTNHGWLRMDRM